MSSPADIDIVVPVHNALALTRACVEAVLADTEAPSIRLFLIDDASDSHTAAYLDSVAARDPRVQCLRNAENLGFLKSCNRGMQAGDAPFVLLLNSDAIMPAGALARMLACMQSDARIASVNPLTNRASQIDLPMPPGSNFASLDAYLRKRTPTYPDIVTGVGFCMLLRRAALDEVGLFDEVYGFGYCEESDLCMRLTTRGWRTVIADDCYVFHRGSASFKDRSERYLANRKEFDRRWLAEYRRQFAAFQRQAPLAPLRAELAPSVRWDPMPQVWSTAREAREMVRLRAPLGLARTLLSGALGVMKSRRPVFSPESLANIDRPGHLRVTYVLHRTVVAGGVLSVIQLVNQLVQLGVEARIATLFLDPAIRSWTPLLAEPIVFSDAHELHRNFPPSDVAVATHWTTADWVVSVCRDGRGGVPVYFVQDYEPWFASAGDDHGARRIAATYDSYEHLIVKSDWLAGKLAAHGKSPHKIPLGMNLGVFYPRGVPRQAELIVGMARPRTPRRGFETLVEALRQVHEQRPGVRIALFGDAQLDASAIPFPFQDLGVLSDQNALAELYSKAAVFIDSSDFQGFGRCALEAMACGAAAVVTGVGGVDEYARHGETARVVSPRDPAAIAREVLALLADDALRNEQSRRGRQEAERFDLYLEGQRTLDLMIELARNAGVGQ